MPHPKRRISKHKKRIRRSHLAVTVNAPHHCARCGAAVRQHRVCDGCGYYGFGKGGSKGTDVLQKDEL
jgi:large subunit ribosomal protein L32